MGLWLVAMIGGGMFAFRELAIVPRAMVGLCAAANAPAICAPRAAVLWLQYQQAFGWAALAIGLAAFISGRRLAGRPWPQHRHRRGGELQRHHRHHRRRARPHHLDWPGHRPL